MVEYYLQLTKYANALGYKVISSDCDSWHYQSKTICNNSRRAPENKVIYLSHECGHADLFESNKDKYFDLFPGFTQEGIGKKVAEIEQEVLAWDRGLSIMKRLHIPVNMKKFAKIKTMCLQEYL